MSRPAAQMRQPASEEEAAEATIEAGDAIANAPHVVELADGRKVDVYRCKVMHISRVLRLVHDFFTELKVESTGDLPKIDLTNPTLILQLFANYTVQVFEVATLLTSLSEDEMQNLEMDDAILIVREVWLLNQNFFLLKILPLTAGLLPPAPDPEDDGSLSPETKSTKVSSTTSSSSSGKGSRKRRSRTSR